MNNDTKAALRKIMAEDGLDTQAVATAISALTFREYSVRTVQAWLADENKKSYRNCPAWVVELLETHRKDIQET